MMTSDVDRVLSWFDSGALVRPGSLQPTTVELARAIASLNGVRDFDADEGAARIAATIGPAAHLVFTVVDGLGMNLLQELPAQSFLRRHLAMELGAVFPSTTAAALTSLATGRWPADHAILGWWTYLPGAEVTATILPFVERFSDRSLTDLGIGPDMAYPAPALMGRFASATTTVTPAAIADSVSSRYFRSGTRARGYESLPEAIDAVIERARARPSRSYTYLYISNVDTAEHRFGWDSVEARAVLLEVDAALASLSARLPDDARLVVSSDHGFLEHVFSGGAEPRRHTLSPDDPLCRLLLVPPYGEPRVPMFRLRSAGARDQFEATFRRQFGGYFALLTTEEVDQLRLFGPGPLSEEARLRLGDYIAFSAGPDVLLYQAQPKMSGYHAGLTRGEMSIPLVVA